MRQYGKPEDYVEIKDDHVSKWNKRNKHQNKNSKSEVKFVYGSTAFENTDISSDDAGKKVDEFDDCGDDEYV